MTWKYNKWLCHERLFTKNIVLHIILYYELKLNEIRVHWLYEERPWKLFSHICINKSIFFSLLRNHCAYLEIQTKFHTIFKTHRSTPFPSTTQMNLNTCKRIILCTKIQVFFSFSFSSVSTFLSNVKMCAKIKLNT